MYVVDYTQSPMMNQTDINDIVELLSKAIKSEDWDLVIEARDYIMEFQDEPNYEEE